MRILILEDCAERRTVMLEHLAGQLPMFGVQFFETSDSMIEYIRQTGLADVSLIALDNDLDPITMPTGDTFDAGDGIAVAQCLATIPQHDRASIPIMIHTTNVPAAATIQECLGAADWQLLRVLPYDGEKWIAEAWMPQIKKAIIQAVTLERSAPPQMLG